VNVLANDSATNPFPSTPLTVVTVRGVSGSALPAGVTVTPSADRSRLTVRVAPGAKPIDTTLQYEVADATGDAARYTWGTVTISVQDRPEPVANVRMAGVADKQLTVAWDAGADNNSAIKNYVVTLVAASGAVVGSTTCNATTCVVPTPGNGPQNAVTVRVSAVNSIGASDPVAYPDAVWSNVVPAAPTDLSVTPGDHTVRVAWNPPDQQSMGGASAVTAYRVTVGTIVRTVGASTTSVDVGGLTNGQQVSVTVASMNDFYGASPVWNTAGPRTATPAGAPIWTSTPIVALKNDASGTVTVTWQGDVDSNGSAITSYSLSCGSDQLSPSTTSATCTLPTGTASTITVTAVNGVGSTTSAGVSATPPAPPATPTRVRVDPASPSDSQDGLFAPTFQGASPAPSISGGGTASYRVSLDGGSSYQVLGFGDRLQLQGNQYGVALSVSVQVAVSYPNGAVLTSGWSSPVSAGMAVDATLVGVKFVPAATGNGGTFSWTSAPGASPTDPSPYNSVQITCGGAPGPGTSCTTDVKGQKLTVSVGANGAFYGMEYPQQ
jgi:hypothetical protein